MAAKARGQPVLQTRQRSPAATAAIGQPAALRDVMPNRHMAATQLSRDPLNPPTQAPQPQHRRDLVRRLHYLPPRQLPPGKRLQQFFHLLTLLISEGASSYRR